MPATAPTASRATTWTPAVQTTSARDARTSLLGVTCAPTIQPACNANQTTSWTPPWTSARSAQLSILTALSVSRPPTARNASWVSTRTLGHVLPAAPTAMRVRVPRTARTVHRATTPQLWAGTLCARSVPTGVWPAIRPVSALTASTSGM